MSDLHTMIETLLALLLVIFVVASIVRWVKLPYPIALLVTGLFGFQPGFRQIVLTPDLILIVFLPILLFEGAYNVSAQNLRQVLVPISLLAIPGVIIGTGATGLLIHLILGLSWPVALLFGALISSTDPIAVVSLFRELGVPKRLALLVEGESLFNDGTAITLFQVILVIILTNRVNIFGSTLQFFVNVLGAIVIGLAIGWGGSKLLRTIDNAQLQITATVIAAYGSYLLAERFGVSGAIAVVITGLFFGNYGVAGDISPASLRAISATWEFLGFLGNSLVFLFIGIALDPLTLARNAGVIAIAFVAALLGRAIAISVLFPLLHQHYHMRIRFQPVLVWGGLRGAVSLALVLSLPLVLANGQPFPERDVLQIIAFGVVGVSLVFQGLTMRPLIQRLGLMNDAAKESEGAALQARMHAVEGALLALDQEHHGGMISDLHYARLSSAYRVEHEQLAQQLQAMPSETGEE